MKIYIRKIITKDNLKDVEFTLEDDGKDEFSIEQEVMSVELVKKLTTEQEHELSRSFKTKDLEIIKDKNGKVEYFD